MGCDQAKTSKHKKPHSYRPKRDHTYLRQGRDGTRWIAAHPHKALAEPLCHHPWTCHCLGHHPRSSCAPHLRLLVRRLPWPFREEVTNVAMHFLAGPHDSPFVKDFSYARYFFGHPWLPPNASNLMPAALPEEHQSFLLPVTPFQNRTNSQDHVQLSASSVDNFRSFWVRKIRSLRMESM